MVPFVRARWLIVLGTVLISTSISCVTTSNECYDPLPWFSTANPHEFLYTVEKDKKRGLIPDFDDEGRNFTITIFGQRATDASNLNKIRTELGDIHDTWNVLALTFTTLCTSTPSLNTARDTLYCGSTLKFGDETALTTTQVAFNVGTDFGRVSVPLAYHKYGARFEMAFLIFDDLGIKFQGGVAAIQQALTVTGGFIDISGYNVPPGASGCATDPCCLQKNLLNASVLLTGTEAIKKIAKELGLDIGNFYKVGFEDLRASIFWRHAISINKGKEDWSHFFIVPFFQVHGSLGIGPEKDPAKVFSVAFGNNGHDSLGVNVGVSLDFQDTLELTVEGGGTFFSREAFKDYRLPSHVKQRGLFPCTGDVCVKPGNNWHFITTIFARRFVDKLSGHVQFLMVDHNRDTITTTRTGVFPSILEDFSKWDVKQMTIGLNYDLSPNVAIGALWQGSFTRRNCPRVHSLYASLVVNF